ncbi:MAG: hypothetical protein KGO49_07635 [Gammaproteobacteria bacterium]|nr:hypothetical protein [Gammaproteobacteria bacterium]
MHPISKFIPILLIGTTSSCFAETEISFNVDADLYSAPLPIHTFTDHWRGAPLENGKTAFAQGKMELKQQQDTLQYSLVWRYDYLLHFTPDTAKLYYQIQNNLPLDTASQYDLLIKASFLESQGFRFGKIWELNPNWHLNAGFTILRGQHFLQGDFSGDGQTNTNNAQQALNNVNYLQAGINYYYDKPVLKEKTLGWNPANPTGYGAALDVALSGLITPEIKLDLSVENIGKMWWQKAPNTTYSMTYNINTLPHFNIDGQLSDDRSFTQPLPYQFNGALAYQPIQQPWSTSLSVNGNQLIQLWQLNTYHDFWNQKFGFHIEPQTKTYGLSIGNKNYGLRYMTDDLNTNKAHRLSLSLYGIYQW